MNDISILKGLKTVSYEFHQLSNKIIMHIEDRISSDGYVYANTYYEWLNEYNEIVKKYNSLIDTNFPMRVVRDYELSSTHKTVRIDAVNAFAQSVRELANQVDREIQAIQNNDVSIPPHQMRVCFKTGAKGCPLNPPERKNKVFIAMSFNDDYRDSYEYGIKIALERLGIDYFRADNEISNKDIMCKICHELQGCDKIIANISGLNPNVMLELGLAYGLGKKVIVVKDAKTITISDLGSVEYIEYSHAYDLQQKLIKALQSL